MSAYYNTFSRVFALLFGLSLGIYKKCYDKEMQRMLWDVRRGVPDKEMENFMRVAATQDDSLHYLDYHDFIGKEGKRVKINEGTFAGVEGVIKRIKKNKHVVVQIEGVAAIAIAFVPSKYLSIL